MEITEIHVICTFGKKIPLDFCGICSAFSLLIIWFSSHELWNSLWQLLSVFTGVSNITCVEWFTEIGKQTVPYKINVLLAILRLLLHVQVWLLQPKPLHQHSVHPTLHSSSLKSFSLFLSPPLLLSLFSLFPLCVCLCAQCVFTVTKAHFQTPPPVVTDTLKVPVMGLAFSHQVSCQQNMLCVARYSSSMPEQIQESRNLTMWNIVHEKGW